MTARPSPATALGPSLLFLGGLCLAAGFAILRDGIGFLPARGLDRIEASAVAPQPLRAPAPLDAAEIAAAQEAWSYFRVNVRPGTGLADSTAAYPSTTMWDQASHLLALVSARLTGVIPEAEFQSRTRLLLSSLRQLPLFDGRLPNKAYNTETLAMVDYANTPVPEGIGWSAIDVSRLLLALRILERHAPEMGDDIRAVVGRWDLAALASAGELTGAAREGEAVVYPQEGRLGYEQYAARAAAMWGVDVAAAISAAAAIGWRDVAGVDVPHDLRNHTVFRAISPTLSEPYVLIGLEMGFDAESALLAAQVYRAQEARFSQTGIPTMVSEDHLDREPWFVYSSVQSDGTDWAVLTDLGQAFPQYRTVSTKAAFAWHALYGTDYSALVRKAVLAGTGDGAGAGPQGVAATGKDGLWAGVYEAGGQPNAVLSLNTNAVVLEALAYQTAGPLWQASARQAP
ncbi:MAG: hypothetical protein RLZZ528_1855 [Pseudomonadota bacterium]